MTWEGNTALRRYLTPVEDLRPHPRNPRRGNLLEIGRSLERFGQQRPVLARPDGTIVAGHHVWQAARQRGWTHVAAVRTDLPDDEVDAYLLADNGTADLGHYDEEQLARLLQQWETAEQLAGTGFTEDDARSLIAAMLWMPSETPEQAPRAGNPREQPLATGTAEAFNIVLTYDEETFDRVAAALDRLLERDGGTTYAEAIRRTILA